MDYHLEMLLPRIPTRDEMAVNVGERPRWWFCTPARKGGSPVLVHSYPMVLLLGWDLAIVRVPQRAGMIVGDVRLADYEHGHGMVWVEVRLEVGERLHNTIRYHSL